MRKGPDGDFTTERREIVAKDDTNEIFNPLTRPFDTTHLDSIRIGYWLDASDVTVKTGVQFSNNGVDFDDAVAIGGSFATTTGWNIPTSYTSLFGLSGPKTYCRFGLFTKNQSGSEPGGAQARMSVEARPMAGRTVIGGPIKVNTDGSTTAIFHPTTGALRAADVGELRATILLDATSGYNVSASLIELQAGYQESDTPDDETSWSSPATAFGNTVTSTTTDFGTTFTDVTLTKRYVRFGLLAKNESSTTDIESCAGTLRVDMRKA